MRFSKKVLFRKFNHFRKQNWSAPAIMSTFIIICMIFIFSLETIGVLNKTKNLPYRLNTPDITLLKEDKIKVDVSKPVPLKKIDKQLIDKKVSVLNDLLYESAINQLNYELKKSIPSDILATLNNEIDMQFLDV